MGHHFWLALGARNSRWWNTREDWILTFSTVLEEGMQCLLEVAVGLEV